MHLDKIVVTLVNQNNKPFRETNVNSVMLGRECSINMPFDTEYKIMFKNIPYTRIRAEIDIDGTNVASSGIVMANGQFYIERFVDIARKFKFVKSEGVGANPNVSDPTNPNNGTIKVTVYREKQPVLKYVAPRVMMFNSRGPVRGCASKGIDNFYGNQVNYGSSLDWNQDEYSVTGDILSADAFIGRSLTEKGATVEGAFSNQSFNQTHWEGDDGPPITFVFNVSGYSEASIKDSQEYKEYLALKAKFAGIE